MALGMVKGQVARPSSRRVIGLQITAATTSRMSAYTKQELQNMLTAFDKSFESRATKAQLVAALNQLKDDIINGTVDLESSDQNDQSGLYESDIMASKIVTQSLQQASLQGWVMKPLVSTAGMKKGSRNEIEILKALPTFFHENRGAFKRLSCSSTFGFDSAFKIRVRHIRSTGLIENKQCDILADSPDGLLAAESDEEFTTVYAVEIKTMTAVRTIQSATNLRQKYGPVLSLKNVGTDEESTKLFRELVPTTAYRAQVLHHAVTLGLNNVLFVVGTAGSITEGKILYCCVIRFAECLRHSYMFIMDCIRSAAFEWIGKETKQIPKEYDEQLKNSHASDLFSLTSYYSLSRAIRSKVLDMGHPVPPSRMIRLTPAVYWNNLKGGVDVISRYLKTLARTNISEDSIVSIIARLLCMQVNNAAVVYRIYLAKQKKMLPLSNDTSREARRGYAFLRHNITQCMTFGSFARRLAKEWTEINMPRGESHDEFRSNDISVEKIKPMFTRHAAQRYNVGTHKARRLNKRIVHNKVSGTATYCVLCSWTLRGSLNGRKSNEKFRAKYSGVVLASKQYVLLVGMNGIQNLCSSELSQVLQREGSLKLMVAQKDVV